MAADPRPDHAPPPETSAAEQWTVAGGPTLPDDALAAVAALLRAVAHRRLRDTRPDGNPEPTQIGEGK
jgi:hypothetical protein